MAQVNRPAIKDRAKQMLGEQMWTLVLITLVVLAIVVALESLGETNEFSLYGSTTISLSTGIFSIIATVVAYIFSISFAKIGMDALDGKHVDVGDAFDGFKDFGRALGVSIVVIIKIFLWMLLFIIPGIIASFRYALVPYLYWEHPEMGISELIDTSSRMMKGYKWDLFVFMLSFLGWVLLVVVTFGIAALWVKPYQEIALAGYYRYVKTYPSPENVAYAPSPSAAPSNPADAGLPHPVDAPRVVPGAPTPGPEDQPESSEKTE